MIARTVVIGTPLGLHARPAARFVQAVADTGLDVTITRDGRTVNAAGILGVMSLDVNGGDTVTLTVDDNGRDDIADVAGRLDALAALLATNLDA
ncbi:HPr family phosphocarrier protein [Bifidobacterium sp. 82T24]|uniref:HPr family phosphocarrier protein n=1 Tax=Bifidobacterium pluvialisilvae TaxID=2834436 RepID=UPI001C5A2AE7|nr:HPr family phosphocarrier protein [Bifidobacterium pluvialisilvae]MBW3087649.1 HPr family phosphocarrier protein [Bifidobacterium pluvialisilvae]